MNVKNALRSAYRTLPFKKQAFGLLRPFNPPHGLYQHLHFEGPFTVQIEPGTSFRMMSYGEEIENELFWRGYGGSWEKISLEVWKRLAKHADGRILDIGANTGAYSLAARACNPRVPIVAFEPIPRIASRMRKNVRLNGFDIIVEEIAVSSESGHAIIYDSDSANNYTASLESTHDSQNRRPLQIRTVVLDQYMEALGRPAVGLIKLDVETHEPAAIRGMVETLKRDRPAVIIEVLRDEIGAEVQPHIDNLGYLTFSIDEDRGLIPGERLHALGGENWNNLLCTQEDFDRAKLGDLIA